MTVKEPGVCASGATDIYYYCNVVVITFLIGAAGEKGHGPGNCGCEALERPESPLLPTRHSSWSGEEERSRVGLRFDND